VTESGVFGNINPEVSDSPHFDRDGIAHGQASGFALRASAATDSLTVPPSRYESSHKHEISIRLERKLSGDVECHEDVAVADVQPFSANHRMSPVLFFAECDLEGTDRTETIRCCLD